MRIYRSVPYFLMGSRHGDPLEVAKLHGQNVKDAGRCNADLLTCRSLEPPSDSVQSPLITQNRDENNEQQTRKQDCPVVIVVTVNE